MSENTENLDYDQLIEAYWKNLNTILRGFKTGAEFLDLWVPDENPLKSILNLIEAAQSNGEDRVSLKVGPATLNQLDLKKLAQDVVGLCDVEIKDNGQGKLLVFTHINDWTNYRGVNPCYAEGVRKASKLIRHEKALTERDGLLKLRINQKNVNLFVLVDTADHKIKEASHQGASSLIDRTLLDALCDILVGLTMQEASDHSVISLEFQLRNRKLKPPVKGIVTPENGDPMFQTPLALVREMLDLYRKSTDYKGNQNYFDRGPSEAWKKLNKEEKTTRLLEAIKALLSSEAILDILKHKPLTIEQFHIFTIEQDVRVTLALESDHANLVKAKFLMTLENELKKTLDEKIQLYLEELKDKNVIRRL